MSERILVVDGHNVMHAWSATKALLASSNGTSTARAHLTSELSLFHDASGWKVLLVFDRASQTVNQSADRSSDSDGIKVIFADGKRSADGIIESITAQFAKDCEMLVASNDRAVAAAAMGNGAEVVSARGLRDLIDRHEKQYRERNRGYFRDRDRRP